MNLSPRWVELLSAAGMEATHWSNLGRFDAPDSVIMAYASHNEYVVLTHDLDFGIMLAASNENRPSVVQIRAGDVDPDMIGAKVVAALRQMEAELREGALLTVDPNRTRLRVLPLRKNS